MKRISALCFLFIALSFSALAQPKAIGLRTGATDLSVSYQHNVTPQIFLEGNVGIDYYRSMAGFKVEALANYVFLKPSWTSRGDWAIYGGAGLATGYVYDISLSTFTYVHPYYGTREQVHDSWGKGFMLGIPLQAGISYTFWFPLQLSIDIRPIMGFQVAERIHPDSDRRSRTGFYSGGLYGFIPSLTASYTF